MTIQKIRSGCITSIVADVYIGERGTIFYNELLGDLRLSNGMTPGGIPIIIGSSGSGNALSIENSGIVLTTQTDSINFTGAGIITTASGNNVTITIPGLQGINLDGGGPMSVYGGIEPIDGGTI